MATDIVWKLPLPRCDFCKIEGVDTLAPYDSPVPSAGGSWANLCEEHFLNLGLPGSPIPFRRITNGG